MDAGAENLNAIAAWAVSLMETLGGFGAGVAIALENLFPPLPSEIILPLAGFTAAQGTLGLIEVLIWTTVGSVVGALALYGIGAWLGRRRMYAIVERMPLLKTEDVERTEAWFEKHGSKAVFFGRMIPIFRSLISIPAGIERMPLLRFTLLTTAGSAIWNTIFVLAGFYLGANWHIVEDYAGIFQKVVIAVVIIAVVAWIIIRVRQMRRNRATVDETVSAD
ncbi:DedA family protein [Microbacterium aerolatum]|uniref:DedA family protein n=1 Tax=Microbacterium aerolatum TaxID=153731 RepID=UPI00200175A2|nr:DedA family protein [Microbacterium aerolatum]MCK3770463.1 DedA family protein [Microbacterium aerolatum]